MALGREVVENGSLPRGDIFSYTAAQREWISSGWGASVLLYLAHRAGGEAGLVWLTFAVAAAAHLIVYFTALRRFRNPGAVALLQLAGILAAYLRYTPRPDLWSHLFVAALVAVLLMASDEAPAGRGGSGEKPRRRGLPGGGVLWTLIPLFALWANFHAGFMAGILAVAVYALWRVARWRLTGSKEDLLAVVPCLLACGAWVLNPYGVRLVALAGKIESIPHVKEKIYEWKPLWAAGPVMLPWPSYAGAALLLGGTVVLVALVFMRGRTRENWPWTLALMALFAGLAVYQRRHMGLAAAALPLLLAPWLGGLEEERGRRGARAAAHAATAAVRSLGRMTAAAVAAVLAIAILQYTGRLGLGRGVFRTGLNATLLPAFAVQWLRDNPAPGNVYNTYGAGAYLLYHLSPGLKVFIDGRLDVYDHQTWLDYLAIEDGTLPLAEAARRYDLHSVILYTKDCASNPEHLAFRLAEDPQWRLVFFDSTYSVFVRETPETRDYVTPRAIRHANPFAIGRFHAALNDPALQSEALAELDRVRRLPGGGGAWAPAMASLAARRMGDTAAADQLLASAMALDPNNPLVRIAREDAGK